MGIKICTDGQAFEVTGEGDQGKFMVHQLNDLVGGHLEFVGLRAFNIDGKFYKFMIVDSNGKRKEKPFNMLASQVGHNCGNLHSKDFVVGDVVLLQEHEVD